MYIMLVFIVILFLDPSNPLLFKVNPSMKSDFMTHIFVDLDFNLSSVCRLTTMLFFLSFFFTTRHADPAQNAREGVGSSQR